MSMSENWESHPMNTKRLLLIVLTLTTAISYCRAQTPASATPAYEAVYVFGHSWGDTKGASGASYWQGRWANGPIWVEQLSTNLDRVYRVSNNFARGGAMSQDVLNQVSAFRPAANPERSLYCFTSFALADFVFNSPSVTNDTLWASTIHNWVGLATNAVLRLYAKGARSILVQNCVDPNRMPTRISGVGTDVSKQVKLSERVTSFNAALAREIKSISESRSDLRIFLIDLQRGLDDLANHSAQYGFTHAIPDALTDRTLVDKSFTGPGVDYLFWDPLHPTAKTHRFIAQWSFDALNAPLERIVSTSDRDKLVIFFTKLAINRAYSVQSSSDLLSWQDVHMFTATAGTNEWTVSERLTPAAFFRLSWQKR